jgi:cytochrome P450
MNVMQRHVTRQFRSFIALLTPQFIPTPGNLKFNRAMQRLDAIIYAMIRARRESGKQPEDVLSALLDAKDENDKPMNDQQIRDEALTLFLAGHDTTANALSWTWYLLAQHPEVEARLHAEVDDVLASRLPSPADLPKLVYTEMVFSEAMRLYPPGYLLSRTALGDDMLPCGVKIPAGTDVWMSPYVVHRDPRLFPNPERFDPERFSEKARQARHPFAYFPFGGGSRSCIGESFARMEGVLLLAAIAQRFKMELVPGQTIVPEPLVTLRPKNGIVMRLSKRS